MIMDTNLKLFSTSNNDTNTATVSTRDEEEDSSITTSSMNTSTSSAEGVHCSTNANNSAERSRRGESSESDNSRKSDSWINGKMTEKASATCHPKVGSGANLVFDDFYLARILTKICPTKFSPNWLYPMKQSYWESYLDDTKSLPRVFRDGDEFESTPEEFLTFVSFDDSDEINSTYRIRCPIRYLSNVGTILEDIKWYLERKERQQTQQRSDSQDGGDNASGDFVVVNGTASGGATTATSSNVVLGSSSTTDVDLLLEDIRSYVWTIVKSIDSKSSKECLIRQQQQQHSSVLKQSIDDDEEKENKALNSIDGNGHQPTQCNDHCDDETVASRTLDTTRQRQTSAESNTSSASSCSFGTSSLKPQFGSILCRLAKVLHGCIESEDTRYSFYHIFNSIARCDKLDFISNSFRKNLNNLINSLANFDLNSGQIMLDATNVSNGPTGKVCKTNSHTDNQRDCSPVIGPQSQSLTASSSLANHFFATGTTHFYQSVLDSCGDDLSTSGGSTASSGYGRSSTASNSSGTGLTSGLGLGAASATQLDSGHPSPTPPVSFRDILAKPTPQNRNSVSPSTGVIGRPSSVEHSNESTLNSCNFLNTQFATSDLCDMNEIPKLISPPNPSVMPQLRHHHNSGATDLYGSDLFDLSSISTKDRLPSLSNHHGNLPRGIIEDNRHHNSNQSNSTFFSDFSNSGLLFGSSNSSGNSQINGNSSNHHDLFSNNDAATIRMGNSHNSPFMVSPIPPVGSTPNQCFTISLDQQAKQESFDEQSDLLDKRTAVAIAAACLTEPTFPPNQNNNNGNSQSNHDSSVPLCDRDLFYRLIISQLLFHGHRNIANQLAAAERIKADGSLLSPNDRLHSLVSNAIRREIDLLRNSAETTPSFTSRASSVVTNITNSNPYQMDSLTSSSFINGNGNGGVKDSSQQNLSTLNRSLVDDSATYSKTIYDRSQSSHGYSSIGTAVSNQIFGGASSAGASRLGIDTNDSTDNLDYVVDVPLDSDMVYTNPSDMYFGSTSSTRSSISTVTSPGLLKQMSHPAVHQLDSHRSQSSASLRSNGIELGAVGTPGTVRSPPTVLDLNNSTSGSGAGSVGGFLLNENAMKNLNQLASKLNDDALSGASTNPIYGRSASAMAMSSNTSVTSVATTLAAQQPMGSGSSYQGQLSRSPIPMMPLNGGMPAKSSNFSTTSNVVPVGPLGPLGPSHTTGNGKNHKIMQIRSKFGSLGSQSNQFSSPHGFCLGMNEEIVIADTNNHRISVYEKNGTFKHSFGSAGKDEGQLWYPRKITMICSPNVRGSLQNPFYVICDRGMERSRMQIFTRNGNFVRKIPIRYIDIVAGIAVNAYGQIVTVDSVSPTIFIISELGELLEWFDCSDHMREPSDIAVFKKEYYICDFKGHCVVVFSERGKCLRKIGIESLTSFPNGIDISTNGDILVGDSHGNRFHVAIFNQEGKLLTEYECPYVKVSRCCGLKLTSEGYVVTLAKNNHHVLVLNTLYIT